MAHRTYKVEESDRPTAVMTHDVLEGTVTEVDHLGQTIDVTLDTPYKPRGLSTTNWGRLQEQGYTGLPSSPQVTTLSDVPIVYNCQEEGESPSGAFQAGDKVLILAIGTDYQAVGFPDEVKDCGPRWFYFKCIGDWVDSGDTPYCTVWDILENKVADIIPRNEDLGGGLATFPLPCEEISDWFDESEEQGQDLLLTGGSGLDASNGTGFALSKRCPAGFIDHDQPAQPPGVPTQPAIVCPKKTKPGDPFDECRCPSGTTQCQECNCECDSSEADTFANPVKGLNGEDLEDSYSMDSFNSTHFYCCRPAFVLDRCGRSDYGLDYNNVHEALWPKEPNDAFGNNYAGSYRLLPQNTWGLNWGKEMSARSRSIQTFDSDQADILWNSICAGRGCPCINPGRFCSTPTRGDLRVFNHQQSYVIKTPIGDMAEEVATQNGIQNVYAATGSAILTRYSGNWSSLESGLPHNRAMRIIVRYTPTVMVQLYIWRYKEITETVTYGFAASPTCFTETSAFTFSPMLFAVLGAAESGIDAENKDPRTQTPNAAFGDAMVDCVRTFMTENGHDPDTTVIAGFNNMFVSGSLRSGGFGTPATTTTV